MVGGTAAAVYGFDLAALQAVADRVGPEVEAVFGGIDTIPADATTFAFGPRTVGVSCDQARSTGPPAVRRTRNCLPRKFYLPLH